MPAEMLQQICENLDQPDLKTFRLACKSFSYAAEAALFRQVLLKRNVESFMKLRMITSHPRLSKLVKALFYSNLNVLEAFRIGTFEEWHDSLTWGGPTRFRTRAICEFAKTLTSEELQVRYKNYWRHHHSEWLMAKYPELESQDLISAFARLPQLEEICFAGGGLPSDDPMSFGQMSAVARETLVEPRYVGCIWLSAEQFTAFLEAAHTVQKPFATIKAIDINWDVFQQSKEVLTMMASTTKACRHLAIELQLGDDRVNGRANLANMITSSRSLHTLEISFDYLLSQENEWIVKLSELFGAGAHWPNLKRLKLQALSATDINLMELLTAHATTLRSLELAHIILEHYRLNGNECHGSWVELIVFLQSSLSLDTVRLHGNLSNRWDEEWFIHDPDESEFWHSVGLSDERPEKGSCLKHRIERFVVEGGVCPLAMPHDAKKAGGWDCIGPGLDRSWDVVDTIEQW